MELLVAGVVGGLLLAVLLMLVLWKVVAAATTNLLEWLIHTFGNERAAKEIEEKWKASNRP